MPNVLDCEVYEGRKSVQAKLDTLRNIILLNNSLPIQQHAFVHFGKSWTQGEEKSCFHFLPVKIHVLASRQ